MRNIYIYIVSWLLFQIAPTTTFGQESPFESKTARYNLNEKYYAAANRLEKYVFSNVENNVNDLYERNYLVFSLLDYTLTEDKFSRVVFNTVDFVFGITGKINVLLGGVLRSQVVGVVLPSFPQGNDLRRLWSRIGTNIGPTTILRNYDVFEGNCVLSNLYSNGKLEKTIAIVISSNSNASLYEQWHPIGSVIPAACLLAGIEYHLGLHNIGAFSPDDLILTDSNTGRRFPNNLPLASIAQLYWSGAQDGDSRAVVRNKVLHYFSSLGTMRHELGAANGK